MKPPSRPKSEVIQSGKPVTGAPTLKAEQKPKDDRAEIFVRTKGGYTFAGKGGKSLDKPEPAPTPPPVGKSSLSFDTDLEWGDIPDDKPKRVKAPDPELVLSDFRSRVKKAEPKLVQSDFKSRFRPSEAKLVDNEFKSRLKDNDGKNWEALQHEKRHAEQKKWAAIETDKKAKEDANWQHGERAKKAPDADLPVQPSDPAHKPVKNPDQPLPSARSQPKAAPVPTPVAPAKTNVAPTPASLAPKATPAVTPPAPPKTSTGATQKSRSTVKAKDQGRMIATTVVNSFVARMMQEAKKRGGALTIADLAGMSGDFAKQTDALTNLLEHSFDAYAKQKERQRWEQLREQPFERMLIEQFSHLLEERGRQTVSPGKLARGVIPGFSNALNMMIGPDEFDRFQTRCRRIVDRIKETAGEDNFEWIMVFDDPAVRSVVLDSLMTIAGYFEDTDRRVRWLIEQIDGPLADARAEGNGTDWRFDEAAAKELLAGLFTVLADALRDTDGRAMLSERFGAEKVAIARRVMKYLQ